MADDTSPSRPISPHIQVYRWPATMATSITHRITGVGNYIGTIFLAWWLIATATGPDAYALFQSVAASPVGLLVLFGYTWSLSYHLINGLRHMRWDMGHGFDNARAERSSIFVLIFSVVVAVLIWASVLLGGVS